MMKQRKSMKRTAFKQNPNKPWKKLNHMSKKRREESKIRNAQWPEFLEKHPNCEIRSKVCTGRTECRHHLRGRTASAFLNEKEQVASCNCCNLYLETEEGKKWGKENGFRLDRIGITSYQANPSGYYE